ncbi:MAG: DJ-1 family glyoxalase III [Huintestinicola sp.]
MIYVFLADGFEETEAITPIDLLRRCGKTVETVGVTGASAVSSHNITVTCDRLLSDISYDDIEMIVLPGGLKGTKNLESSEGVQKCIDYCAENGILIGAICAAPSILGHKGLLKGRKAVCYPGFEEALEGAEVLSVPAVRDGNIITARGAGASLEFAEALISAVDSPEKAKKIAEQIIWKRN